VAEGLYYGRVHLIHLPAEELPFADNLFDLVTCLEALEFMIHPKTVIAELVRVTRPGGWLLLTNRKGFDAALMPGKTWSNEQAKAIYREEFGLLDVRIQTWQLDYDLVWAKKAGTSLPTRARPLEEIWLCPRCGKPEMILVEEAYVCGECEARVPVSKDGVIEVMG
jgi:SAM-dependent methyltransferase